MEDLQPNRTEHEASVILNNMAAGVRGVCCRCSDAKNWARSCRNQRKKLQKSSSAAQNLQHLLDIGIRPTATTTRLYSLEAFEQNSL